MATKMAVNAVALPTMASSTLVSVQAAKLSCQSASPRGVIRCNNDQHQESNQKTGPLRLSAVVVPMLAAAFVGSVQPAVQASEWDQLLVPVDNTETSSSDGPYKDLLEKMKQLYNEAVPESVTLKEYSQNGHVEIIKIERRAAREKKTPTFKAEESKSEEGASTYSSPFFSPAPVYTPPAPPASPPVVQTPEPAPAPSVAQSSPAESFPVATAEKQKTHGFLPLFLTQFLLLVATVGGGYVLLTTPDSKWDEVQKTVDGLVAKVTPVVEDSWSKAKPLAIQAQQKASHFAETAKPYVVKAWEASKPLAAKAVEASKPILKGAQTKAAELFEQATSNKQ